jgi:hypothetical protein
MFFFFYPPGEDFDYGESMRRLHRSLEVARSAAPNISVSTLASFVAVAVHCKELTSLETSLPQFARRIGIPYSRLLRELDVLSDGTPDRPGLRLLDKFLDPEAPRYRKFLPSLNGQKVLLGMMDELPPPKLVNHDQSPE